MPTDIVNHRLKIAIEIQSEWHDNEYSKTKDAIKRRFWIDKGYSFYDPDIRDYSVLEMCQLFFKIDQIPDWINFEYSNKLNIKIAQEFLNKGLSVIDVANEMMNLSKLNLLTQASQAMMTQAKSQPEGIMQLLR